MKIKRFLQKNTILLFSFLLCLLTGCNSIKNPATGGKNLTTKHLREYKEELYAELTEEDGVFCSVFIDNDKPFCLVYTGAEQEGEQYKIIDPKNNENISRFSDSLVNFQKLELPKTKQYSYTAQCPGDGSLYLIGKDKDNRVQKLYCLFPDSTNFIEIMAFQKLKSNRVIDVDFTREGFCYIKTSDYLYSYHMKSNFFQGECYVYSFDYANDEVCQIVPGSMYIYFLFTGKYYMLDRSSIYNDMVRVSNNLITDATSPAFVDENDRIFIADSCGIMSHAPHGKLWELLVNGEDKEGFNRTNYNLLNLFGTQSEYFYLTVQDKESGRVKIYAYIND